MVATLAVAALLLAVALVAVLSRSEVRRTGTNDVLVQRQVGALQGAHRVCQDGERIPAGTGAIAVSAVRDGGPATVAVELAGIDGRRLARGAAPARSFDTTVVRLRPAVAADVAGTLCLDLRTEAGASVLLFGDRTDGVPPATERGRTLDGTIRVEYLRPAGESWWSFAPTVVDRVGLAHAWSGPSVALLAALLTLTSIALAAWLLVRTS